MLDFHLQPLALTELAQFQRYCILGLEDRQDISYETVLFFQSTLLYIHPNLSSPYIQLHQ